MSEEDLARPIMRQRPQADCERERPSPDSEYLLVVGVSLEGALHVRLAGGGESISVRVPPSAGGGFVTATVPHGLVEGDTFDVEV